MAKRREQKLKEDERAMLEKKQSLNSDNYSVLSSQGGLASEELSLQQVMTSAEQGRSCTDRAMYEGMEVIEAGHFPLMFQFSNLQRVNKQRLDPMDQATALFLVLRARFPDSGPPALTKFFVSQQIFLLIYSYRLLPRSEAYLMFLSGCFAF